MSLSGNLGFVSLDEVLRLLTRSNQQGVLDVRGDQIHGRVFVSGGGIGLATTFDDAGLHRLLLRSELVDESMLNRIQAGETTLAPAVDASSSLQDLLREMTVESVYQMGLNGESFDVQEGVSTAFATSKAFDLEAVLADSKQRLTDWAEVMAVLDDLAAPLELVRDLGDRDEVKIDQEGWQVVSEIRAGSSVSQMADRLGTTEFWTARVASRLMKKDLVAYAQDPVASASEESYQTADSDDWDFSSQPVEDSAVVAADENADDAPHDESWWQEPEVPADEVSESELQADEADADAEVDEETEASDYMPTAEPTEPAEAFEPVASEEFAEIPTLATAEANAEVEEDTEAFLEKVFSELEAPEESQNEEEGYGLLRRRRMGAMRDVSDS